MRYNEYWALPERIVEHFKSTASHNILLPYPWLTSSVVGKDSDETRTQGSLDRSGCSNLSKLGGPDCGPG